MKANANGKDTAKGTGATNTGKFTTTTGKVRSSPLPQRVKNFIVDSFAGGAGVAEVAKLVRDRYKREVTYQQLMHYHALRASSAGLAPDLRKRFMAMRAKAIEATDETDLAHKAVRMHRLDFLMDQAEATNNTKLQISVLDLARKEMQEFILLSPDDGEE